MRLCVVQCLADYRYSLRQHLVMTNAGTFAQHDPNSTNAVLFIFFNADSYGCQTEIGRVVRDVTPNTQIAREVRDAIRSDSGVLEEELARWSLSESTTYGEFDLITLDDSIENPSLQRNFGPEFLVVPGGHVVTNRSSAFQHHFTFEAVERAVEAGLESYYVSTIRVYAPVGGRGATGFQAEDFVIWLLGHGVDLGIAGAFTWAISRIRGGRADRRARRLAHDWDAAGFTGPRVLRIFLERRIRWDIADLCQKLRINRRVARSLLLATGYVEIGDAWEIGSTWRARRRRRRWIKKEY